MQKEEKTYGTGRRKRAIARVFVKPGSGDIKINSMSGGLYLQNNTTTLAKIKEPLVLLGLADAYDLQINAHGGGIKCQADAICLGLSRALCIESPGNRILLKSAGYLTRDARVKERKKYGLKKARKASQFSKR
jgi:small subunit ribosomal protein S9